MLFNSYIFIFLFFPLCILGFYLIQKINATAAKVWLIGFSLWFYGYFNIRYLCIMIFSILFNYGIYLWMSRARQGNFSTATKDQVVVLNEKGKATNASPIPTTTPKTVLILGVATNLLVLFYFKYFDFFVSNINVLFKQSIPLQHVLLPLGISFFTFQQISFIVDTYRGELEGCGFVDYALFVSFFPQLIAGPIVTHEEMLPQFALIGRKKWDIDQFARGLYVFVLGLAKKVLVADTFSKAVNMGYSSISLLSATDALLIMLFYTLQLYFDFSGYCDMAIGIGKMFGIEIPMNFNSPYKATNIIEFWKRWHITLSRFFTKNIYIPLGGNRKGYTKMYCNLFLVFFLSGLWHGAGWQFILWGVMHGVLYLITRAYQLAKKKKQKQSKIVELEKEKRKKPWNMVKQVICVCLTFLYVNVAWIFFRAPSVSDAIAVIKCIFSGVFRKPMDGIVNAFNLDEFWYVLKVLHLTDFTYSRDILMITFTLIVLLATFFGKNTLELAKKWKPDWIRGAVTVILFVWCVVSLSGVSTFLYFNF